MSRGKKRGGRGDNEAIIHTGGYKTWIVLKESIYLHYDSKHVILDRLQPCYWPHEPIQTDLSEFFTQGNKRLLFLSALPVPLSPVVCSVFTEPLLQILQGSQKRNVQFWLILSLAVLNWSCWSPLSFTVFGQLNETLISQTPSLYVSFLISLPKVSVPQPVPGAAIWFCL